MGKREVAYAAFCGVCWLAVVGAGHAWFASGPGLSWFGLPVSLVWTVGWVGASFFALLAFHLTRGRP